MTQLYRGEAITALVEEVAALVTEANGFDSDDGVALGCRAEESAHCEVIRCPECKSIQKAEVTHTRPWYSYVHFCTKCEYIIMESEWEPVNKEDLTGDDLEEYRIVMMPQLIAIGVSRKGEPFAVRSVYTPKEIRK